MRNEKRFRNLIGISIFSALGAILLFFEFPVLFWFPFLKVDLSDVVTIIGAFVYGPIGGTLIAFIRSLIHLIISGSGVAGVIGNFSGFVGSVSLMLPFYYFWNRDKKVMAVISSTISMTVIMSLLNYFVVMPLYMNVVGMQLGMSLGKYILTGVIPFNIIKALIINIAVILIYPRMRNFLTKWRNA
ncbi:ECF transporter S component [Lactobacillus terrae]|uniref:ECF transporter S component n=1 Tax=Lactobacillus terrae TaxID=2269374 RepID=UPI000C1B6B26|nr:ECF transporter S component [Lactobacillus terrae]